LVWHEIHRPQPKLRTDAYGNAFAPFVVHGTADGEIDGVISAYTAANRGTLEVVDGTIDHAKASKSI
jgi:hypothetical protein